MTKAQPTDWIHLAAGLAVRWAAQHGPAARAFADRVPDMLAALAAVWDLQIGDPVGMGYESLAIAATGSNGAELVVKLSPPGPRVQEESRAYHALTGPGMARLVDARPAEGALLLQRIHPGTALKAEPDDERAADALAWVLGAGLSGGPGDWRAFPRLNGQEQLSALDPWANYMVGLNDPAKAAVAGSAVRVATHLWNTAPTPHLLHGDLHDQNILDAGGGRFLAIDPKGVVGDPAYEPACFLMNRWIRDGANRSVGSMVRYAQGVARRLGLDPNRVVAWAFVHTAVSLAWSWESQDPDGSPRGPSGQAEQRWLVLRALAQALGQR
jgi:streptomycin 6-kinase